jgi:opacity protein-like surface antigen
MCVRTFPVGVVCACIFVALIAALPLKADDGFRFGGALSIVFPDKLLSDVSKLGLSGSIFGEWGFKNNQALRGKAEYAIFGARISEYHSSNDYYLKRTSSANVTVVMADYIYKFSPNDECFYVFGGVGFVNGVQKLESKDPWGAGSNSKSGSGLGFSVGVGYNLGRNTGFEISYTTTPGEIIIGDEVPEPSNLGFDWMQISFRYRF